MTDKRVKIPGPDHPITIDLNPLRVVVTLNGQILADSHSALTLREAKYPAVQYIPRADVDMTLLTRTSHSTYCPYKGDCSYFSLPTDSENGENAVWTYESAYPAVAAIEGHLAFYADRVDIRESAE